MVAALVASSAFVGRSGAASPRPAIQPPMTVTFTAIGQVMQQFTVPATVTSMQYDIRGGSGAGGGGRGGLAIGTMTVTPGTVLDIWVGFAGGLPGPVLGGGAGGWGGRDGMRHGGNGGGVTTQAGGGGGGGGATEVSLHGVVAAPLLMGGGGGGAGALAGSSCGSSGTGGCGAQGPTNPEGTNGGMGVGGVGADLASPGGGANAAGGSSGSGARGGGSAGESSTTGAGGAGASCSMCNGAGGGGGGGYGGGGGGGADIAHGAGGGSGRSLGWDKNASFGPAPTLGNGSVSFTFVPPSAPAGATRFVPVPPSRLLDTREAADITVGHPVPAGGGIDLQVTGRGGVPASNVTAVVLNVTAANSFAPGFVTIWPATEDRPNVSNLNVTAAGQNIANLVTVRLGTAGKVSLFSQSGGDLVADVAGYYEPVTTSTSAGRYSPNAPDRILDTRSSVGVPGTLPVAADRSIDLTIAGRGGVPATGASAVVLNVTAADALGTGFVTVWPKGSKRPTASNINVTFAGQNIANLVIVPIGADGSVSLYTQGGAHLVADVAGWFGDASQPASFSGLFQPLTPSRLLDTRTMPDFAASGVPADSRIDLTVAGKGGVPAAGVGAVVLNVTAAAATAPGFVTIWPAGTIRPTASNINVTFGGQNIPNLVSVTVGAGGGVSLYTQAGAQLLADIAGYYIA